MKRAVYGAGSAEQVGPDRWRLRWSEGVDPFTGRHRRRTETITARTAKEARRELAARTSAHRRLSRVTFGDLLDLALRQLPVSERTRDNYGFALTHIPDAARGWVAADISVMDARVIIEGLTDRVGPQVVRKIHGALMSCWRQAHLNGWVDFNPWRGQRLPKVPTSAGAVISDTEVDALYAVCDPLERVWLQLHFDTGARPGEVLGLRWSTIDLADTTVTFIDAKHGGRERPVALTASCAAQIRAWQHTQRERAVRKAGTTLDPDPYLISSTEDSGTPWTVGYAGGFRWRHLSLRAGLGERIATGHIVCKYRLYDTRHTHNSWLAAAGIDAPTRAGRIGNSPATNQRVYSHSTQDREAAAAIDARRGIS